MLALFEDKVRLIDKDDKPVLICASNLDSCVHHASEYEALLKAQWIVGA
jgi:hypothetical protein